NTMGRFVHDKLIAVWTAGVIEPRLKKHSRGPDDEGVVIHPCADRVPVVAEIRILGRLPPIGPDDAIVAVKRTQHDHLLGGLHHVDGPELPAKHIGESQRVALASGSLVSTESTCRTPGPEGLFFLSAARPAGVYGSGLAMP